MSRSSSLPWDPQLLLDKPWFAPLLPQAGGLLDCAVWPGRERLNDFLAGRAITSGGGMPLRFVAPSSSAPSTHPGYEPRVYLTGELETREANWHDLFNALIWLTYPKTKAALNTRHYAAPRHASPPGGRGPERDALTQFDESGVIVASGDASLLSLVREFAWKELFWRRREDVVRRLRVYLFGHGLCEMALQPFIGLTGKAVLLDVDADFAAQPLARQMAVIDERLVELVADRERFRRPRELSPLPLLGLPGWLAENADESFYDNTDYFRPGRRRDA